MLIFVVIEKQEHVIRTSYFVIKLRETSDIETTLVVKEHAIDRSHFRDKTALDSRNKLLKVDRAVAGRERIFGIVKHAKF